MTYDEFCQLPVEILDTTDFSDDSEPPPETKRRETTIGEHYGRAAEDLFKHYGHRQPVRVLITSLTRLHRNGQSSSITTMHFTDDTALDLRKEEIRRTRRRLGLKRNR